MNAQSVIKSYISPKPILRILALATAVLGAVFLALAFGAGGNDDKASAEPFYPSDSATGSYCYVDVVGVSDWLYKVGDYDTYYTIQDNENYFYIAKIPSSTIKKLSAQSAFFEAYMNKEASIDDAPQPYRLYGVVRSVGSETKKNICDVWGFESTDYDRIFGINMLDAGSSPSSDKTGGFAAGSVLLLSFALIFGILVLVTNSKVKKSLNRLEELGLTEQAAGELDMSGADVIGKDAARLTDHFIFGKGTGIALRYEDVVWAYKRIQRYNFVAVSESLMLYAVYPIDQLSLITTTGRGSSKGLIESAIQLIYSRNPNAMIGYNGEYLKAYRDYRKQAKSGNPTVPPVN